MITNVRGYTIKGLFGLKSPAAFPGKKSQKVIVGLQKKANQPIKVQIGLYVSEWYCTTKANKPANWRESRISFLSEQPQTAP